MSLYLIHTFKFSCYFSGYLPQSCINAMLPSVQFDELYTRLVHNRASSVDCDTEDSDSAGQRSRSESDEDYEYDGYEYDDDIYGYSEYENWRGPILNMF